MKPERARAVVRRAASADGSPGAVSDLPFALSRVTSASRRRAGEILAALERAYPDARCELRYATPHELLVATILSAQATDASVNKVTPALFARFPAPADYGAATPAQIEPLIRSIGLFRNKARAIHASMRDVAEQFGGQVPRTMDELLTLRGVARKTANVVLGNAYGINVGIPIDTHVQRVAVRLGLVRAGESVAMIERRLMALLPRERWCDASHLLIFHGRYACKARCPKEGGCHDSPICARFGRACECRRG